MGGCGSKSGAGWKSALRKQAKSGRVPSWLMGSPETRGEMFKEINKLYPELDNTEHWQRDAKLTIDPSDDYIHFEYRDDEGPHYGRYKYRAEEVGDPESRRGFEKWFYWYHYQDELKRKLKKK